MAQHQVTFTIPKRELQLSDLEVRVRSNGKMMGRLRISKGSLVWLPKYHANGYKFSWEDFNDVAINHGEYGYR